MTAPAELDALRAKVRDFIEQHAIPREDPALAHDVGRLDAAVAELRAVARAAGIYAPHLPVEIGGLGLDWQQRAAILEEAGRSSSARRRSTARRPTSRTWSTCCVTARRHSARPT